MTPRRARSRLSFAELYCGIGGCAAAVGSSATVVAAVDIDRTALDVYRRNFPHPTATATLESLTGTTLHEWRADVWWMSPPCQPFTRRGRQRDVRDSRTRSFLELISRLKEVRPRYLAIENVPGFQASVTHAVLRDALDRLDYEVREWLLCPTILGVPNRRERFYLVAGREALREPPPPSLARPLLRAYLDPEPEPELWVDGALVERYRHALDVVDPGDARAVAACFTSAYGHSPVRSGSYLQTSSGLRRFAPSEILRLLGFPSSYTLPPELLLQRAWRLVGNSLSVPAVRHVLSAIPELSLARGAGPRAEDSKRLLEGRRR